MNLKQASVNKRSKPSPMKSPLATYKKLQTNSNISSKKIGQKGAKPLVYNEKKDNRRLNEESYNPADNQTMKRDEQGVEPALRSLHGSESKMSRASAQKSVGNMNKACPSKAGSSSHHLHQHMEVSASVMF